jgi:hypothetical protein
VRNILEGCKIQKENFILIICFVTHPKFLQLINAKERRKDPFRSWMREEAKNNSRRRELRYKFP